MGSGEKSKGKKENGGKGKRKFRRQNKKYKNEEIKKKLERNKKEM